MLLLLRFADNFQRCSIKWCRCNASDVDFHLLCLGRPIATANKWIKTKSKFEFPDHLRRCLREIQF